MVLKGTGCEKVNWSEMTIAEVRWMSLAKTLMTIKETEKEGIS
jgi:hypothetical protein